MERPAARVCILAVLAVCASACSADSRPTGPTPPAVAAPPTVPAPGGFPPPSGNRRTYAFDSPVGASVASYTRASRYSLYENGAFELSVRDRRHLSGPVRADELAPDFLLEGWSTAGPWGATASLDGDTLTVRYNTVMMLTDFEDAVYRLQPN